MNNRYLDLLASFGIGGAHPGGFALTEAILEDEMVQPTDSLLDIGCGTGQTAAFLAQRFECQVTGIDNHPIMLEKARERFKNKQSRVKIMEGDAQNLNLKDNSFDLILAESVIAFTDISKTLDELARVLKSDGCMIMIEMTAEKQLSEEMQRKVYGLYGINEILNEEEWKLKLQHAGFSRIEILHVPSELTATEVNDINQSKNIDLTYFDLWDEHYNFTDQNRQLIGFRVFRCHLT